MLLTREATAALNDYVDQVNRALPLAPSQRMPKVDKLYRQIVAGCEDSARESNRLQIDLDIMQSHLQSLGSPEQAAEQLVSEQRWSADSFSFDRHSINEKASAFAKAAAERGEHVARMSMEVAANAFDIAAQKLREAAEKIKAKVS